MGADEHDAVDPAQDSSLESKEQAGSPSSAGNGNDQPEKSPPQEPATSGSDQQADSDEKEGAQKGPPGGYDSTPVPDATPGYTVKFTIHRATALPMADITYSSDPYFTAQLTADRPTRHKEDPMMMYRSKVIWSNTNPEWEAEWIVANVPQSGFRLKIRIYDEDIRDQDDRLGNVVISASNIGSDWEGIVEQAYKIKKRMASKRAYFLRAIAVCTHQAEEMSGKLWASVKVLEQTDSNTHGRMYTVGPENWSKHFSPLLGRMAGTKGNTETANSSRKKSKSQTQRYNFEANQIQLQGPVPEELYHRYVEFKPFVKSMFTAKGIGGIILSKALHHQHIHVYNHSKSTIYGSFPGPSTDVTKHFLDFVHYDKGGRIFTYIITLDGLWRFTETGKEFGIDMLSKHTMHSDVSVYIAFSGEFFVRRIKRPHAHHSTSHKSHKSHASQSSGEMHPPAHLDREEEEHPPTDPSRYHLFIDNDSGTYRPNAKLLPLLRTFLERNLPGLTVTTLDCQADADEMSRMKDEQREAKKRGGDNLVFTQLGRSGSFSSSDESRLDDNYEAAAAQNSKNAITTRQARRALKRTAKQRTGPKKEKDSQTPTTEDADGSEDSAVG